MSLWKKGDFMCTAISYTGADFYFGRNLDYEHSFGEKIIVTSRDFPLLLRHEEGFYSHYAIIGMGIVSNNFPLYFDGANEEGLSVAGLLFPHFSVYRPVMEKKVNIASFEFIPYILARCKSVSEAKLILHDVNITDTHFCADMPPSPLHWIIADKEGCIVVESVKEGVMVYDNPAKTLTNAPPFPSQLHNSAQYSLLSPHAPESELPQHSNGLGAVGLPGDFSSQSRFVRASFLRKNSPPMEKEEDCVGQVFHILESVSQPKGSVITEKGGHFTTHYSACINADKGVYYYRTYNNSCPCAVSLSDHDIDRDMLYTFDLSREWRVNYQR